VRALSAARSAAAQGGMNLWVRLPNRWTRQICWREPMKKASYLRQAAFVEPGRCACFAGLVPERLTGLRILGRREGRARTDAPTARRRTRPVMV
jgi:hypothetical protein